MNPKIMVLKGGSPAIHILGDIGRDEDDFIWVQDETENQYIGQFEEGFGFIDVRFNKLDVRSCTNEEIDKLNECYYCINGTPRYKNNFNYDGTVGKIKG